MTDVKHDDWPDVEELNRRIKRLETKNRKLRLTLRRLHQHYHSNSSPIWAGAHEKPSMDIKITSDL